VFQAARAEDHFCIRGVEILQFLDGWAYKCWRAARGALNDVDLGQLEIAAYTILVTEDVLEYFFYGVCCLLWKVVV
jgi:hypothetical protein